MALARVPLCRAPVASTHRDAGPQRKGRERVAPPAGAAATASASTASAAGDVAAHDVRLREHLEGQGPPGAARPLRGDGSRRIRERVGRPAADHRRTQHCPCGFERCRPVGGSPVEGGALDDVRHALRCLRPTAERVDEGRTEGERRPALEDTRVEGSQPLAEAIAVAKEIGLQRRCLDQPRSCVGIAARDGVLDRELRPTGIGIPRRRPAVEARLGLRLATFQLGRQVVSQEAVIAERRLLAGDLADEEVCAGQPSQPLGGVGLVRHVLGEPRLDDVEDRRPREDRDVAVIEDGAQLGSQVLRDVSITPGRLAHPGGARPGALMAQGGQVDGRSPSLRPVRKRPGLLPAQPLPDTRRESLGLLRVERQLLAPDLEQPPVRPQPREGQVRRRSRGKDHLEAGGQVLESAPRARRGSSGPPAGGRRRGPGRPGAATGASPRRGGGWRRPGCASPAPRAQCRWMGRRAPRGRSPRRCRSGTRSARCRTRPASATRRPAAARAAQSARSTVLPYPAGAMTDTTGGGGSVMSSPVSRGRTTVAGPGTGG